MREVLEMNEEVTMDEHASEAIEAVSDENGVNPAEAPQVRNVRTFESAGVLTMNKGLVVSMTDGSEFQLTIVQSKLAREG